MKVTLSRPFALQLAPSGRVFGSSPWAWPSAQSGDLSREAPELTLSFTCLFKKYLFLILVVLGLHCCARAFSSCSERGLLFVAVRGLLIVVAYLVAEHRL